MASLKEIEFKEKLAALMIEYQVVLEKTAMAFIFVSKPNDIYLHVDELAEELKD